MLSDASKLATRVSIASAPHPAVQWCLATLDSVWFGVAARTFGLFHLFYIVTSYRMPSADFTCLLLWCAVACLAATTHAPRSAWSGLLAPARTNWKLATLGAWRAVNLLALVTAVCRLHPLRHVVGEYLEYGVFFLLTVKSSAGPRLAEGTSSSSKRQQAALFASSVLLLGWAGNLSPYRVSVAEGEAEEAAHVIDSVGGIGLLVALCFSQVFYRRQRFRLAIDAEESKLPLECYICGFAAVFATGLCVLWNVLSESFPCFFHPSFFSFLQTAFSAIVLVVLPHVGDLVPKSWAGAHRGSCNPQQCSFFLRLAASTSLSFLLHFLFMKAHSSSDRFFFSSEHVFVTLSAILMGVGLTKASTNSDFSKSTKDGFSDALLAPTELGTGITFESAMRTAKQRKLLAFLSLTLFFMLVELGVGIHANSLGLVSDSLPHAAGLHRHCVRAYCSRLSSVACDDEAPLRLRPLRDGQRLRERSVAAVCCCVRLLGGLRAHNESHRRGRAVLALGQLDGLRGESHWRFFLPREPVPLPC